MTTRLPFATLTCTVFIVLGSFLPWAYFNYDYDWPFKVFTPSGNDSVVATAWNTNLSALGFLTPNWIVVPVAVIIAALMLLAAFELWPTAQRLAGWLCWYGIIYSAICLYRIVGALLMHLHADNQFGAGSLITLACFIVMAVQAGLFEPAPANRATPVRSE